MDLRSHIQEIKTIGTQADSSDNNGNSMFHNNISRFIWLHPVM